MWQRLLLRGLPSQPTHHLSNNPPILAGFIIQHDENHSAFALIAVLPGHLIIFMSGYMVYPFLP
jgi:hypothetical protein